MKYILLTGGAGYIGSHMYVFLKSQNLTPIILDNYSNSNYKVLQKIKLITNDDVISYKGDISDAKLVIDIINKYEISSIIHFAALKSVENSNLEPTLYLNNNVNGFISLLGAMLKTKCRKVILSSSACVYGNPNQLPIKEEHELKPLNVYGQTKLMCEQILTSYSKSNEKIQFSILRYFNPIGAHQSGLIGEDPLGEPSNIMPYLSQVAIGVRKSINVFGNDYKTLDGTGVRDYIHIDDLVAGHFASLEKIFSTNENIICNLGTGKGYSVLEMINTYEQACGKKIHYNFVSRRTGDIDASYADITYAKSVYKWEAKKSLLEMCKSSWNWQKNNPNGYKF